RAREPRGRPRRDRALRLQGDGLHPRRDGDHPSDAGGRGARGLASRPAGAGRADAQVPDPARRPLLVRGRVRLLRMAGLSSSGPEAPLGPAHRPSDLGAAVKLALELDTDRFAPGEEVTGRVEALEGGPSRSLT